MSEAATVVNPVMDDDEQELLALQRAAERGPSGPAGGAGDDEEITVDFGQGGEYADAIPEGYYLMQIISAESKTSAESQDALSGEKSGGNKYINLGMKILHGDWKNRIQYDRLMLTGKTATALQQFHILICALGQYDRESKRWTGSIKKLVGGRVWVKLLKKNVEYPKGSGDFNWRNEVAFKGYEAPSAHAIPEELTGGAPINEAHVTPPPPSSANGHGPAEQVRVTPPPAAQA